MSRLIQSLCVAPSFTAFGSNTFLGGATGKTNGAFHVAATNIQIWGFGHLTGQTVGAMIGGLYCGTYTVAADGSITVLMGSDPDGLLSEAYLQPLDSSTAYGELGASITLNGFDTPITVTVPVAVGVPFTSQGQVLRPVLDQETKLSHGSGLGNRRRAHRAAILFHNTVYPSVGTDFSATLQDAYLPAADGTRGLHNVMFNGVSWQSMEEGHSLDGMVSWSITKPWPCTVCSLTGYIDTAEI